MNATRRRDSFPIGRVGHSGRPVDPGRKDPIPPDWLETVAWFSLALAAVCAALILWDVFIRGYRQRMAVMEAVWPITALYMGPLGLWAYSRWGRPKSPKFERENGPAGQRPFRVRVAVSASHCGAGCTLGDIVAAWLVFALGLSAAGLALPWELGLGYLLALAFGVGFQVWAIRPMNRELRGPELLKRAFKADVISLSAFEVGLFGWMAVTQLVLFTDPHLPPDTATYWLMMQIGMALGFVTTYPVNIWLIRRGVKEAMA